MRRLLIGLGNIGPEYAYTRHNIGFLILDYLANQQEVDFQNGKLASIATFSYKGYQVSMIKPTTYMNDSGKALRYWLHYFKLPVEDSITVVDDITLPFGTMRLRAQGSDAGHNGLKSIATYVGSNVYPRLRVGIGNDFPKGKLTDFVLGAFLPKELEALPVQLDEACARLLMWCHAGMVHTMNYYNKGF